VPPFKFQTHSSHPLTFLPPSSPHNLLSPSPLAHQTTNSQRTTGFNNGRPVAQSILLVSPSPQGKFLPFFLYFYFYFRTVPCTGHASPCHHCLNISAHHNPSCRHHPSWRGNTLKPAMYDAPVIHDGTYPALHLVTVRYRACHRLPRKCSYYMVMTTL
jgi:hypothetical protein